MELNFWVMKWVKWLKNKGFDDMGYDMWVEGGGFGILLDFVEILTIEGRMDF